LAPRAGVDRAAALPQAACPPMAARSSSVSLVSAAIAALCPAIVARDGTGGGSNCSPGLFMPAARNDSSIITRPLAVATCVVPSWPGSENTLRGRGLAVRRGQGSRLPTPAPWPEMRPQLRPWPPCWSGPRGRVFGRGKRKDGPGRAFEPGGLPDLPGRGFIWPNRPQTARHGTTTWTLHPGTLRKSNACGFGQGKVLAGRKPTLLLRFVGT